MAALRWGNTLKPGSDYVIFVVRVARDEQGRVTGIVERVRTGEKARFSGLDELRRMIENFIGGRDAGFEDENL
jgi:hypothetical protein